MHVQADARPASLAIDLAFVTPAALVPCSTSTTTCLVGNVRPSNSRGNVIPEIRVMYDAARGDVGLRMRNVGTDRCAFKLEAIGYEAFRDETIRVAGAAEREQFRGLVAAKERALGTTSR